ncbi:16S rRNA (uracil(1498)-N(3))-methyltransferase [Phaeobacter gallaeciensis]|uniref:16S rRNA (uracil(1498)-N(3))-methyltransferase n=1 Tax=Phaeobacter gallaeciensis TaxID=60890 RepID=UPI002380199A|nr:16S rRNA (uracil(1498)-N(3))-methyltransferase [Phaeobacter gallaeciensis]MDE4273601.1 16S rRNA (uracil(1498)-N(3))-methyltransferase [Phaeobacter gallaeciensis]MDE4298841.1 16S rRNA (uracil(1498)-N(3))-methyltransferase [Phaeobacter gallaeciensis]MDE5183587.1 16S rRNA (uracil(1498)-N(3))-methyltransferase [Phaeobacter gallaeciensis]
MSAKIRLYVEHPLGAGQTIPLDRDQAHYLFGVMRQAVGAKVALFNGRDGEWLAEVAEAGKRGGVLSCLEQTRPLQMPPDLWLIFAPIKKARTDFIVEKAAEMGAARIMPVQTEFTNSERIRQDRLQAHAVEAAEQCGGTFVPEVTDLQKLSRLLDHWPQERQLMFCDEAEVGQRLFLDRVEGDARLGADGRCPAYRPGEVSQPGSWAILIGPEGGFSEVERKRLHGMQQAHVVSLGPRILRADTAAVAAMTLWQQSLGDW